MNRSDAVGTGGAVTISGSDLSLEAIAEGARAQGTFFRLSGAAQEGIRRSRAYVEARIESGEQVYGVTTGFGRLAEMVIPEGQRAALQRNLVRSHSAGLGRLLTREEVRTIMILRANALARGHSGCRVDVVERLLEYLNLGIHPSVPEVGSVGASGDLAPLAHIALGLIGEGKVEYRGVLRNTADVLREVGLDPLELLEKEGLALINGTQATTGIGLLSFLRAVNALEALEVAGAMTLEGLKGTPEA